MTTTQEEAIAEAVGSSIDYTAVVEAVSSTFSPEEVFSESELEDWATENGYKKEE